MSSFLERLASRSIGAARTIRPRTKPGFSVAQEATEEPVPETLGPISIESLDESLSHRAVAAVDAAREPPYDAPLVTAEQRRQMRMPDAPPGRVKRADPPEPRRGGGLDDERAVRHVPPPSRHEPLSREVADTLLPRRAAPPPGMSRAERVPSPSPTPAFHGSTPLTQHPQRGDAIHANVVMPPDPPPIEIRIGRIDVVAPPAPEKRPATPVRRAGAATPMTLGEYFARRRGGRP